MAKPRRVRVGNCPHCSSKTPIDPRTKGDPWISICRSCFAAIDNEKLATWLEEPKAAKGGV